MLKKTKQTLKQVNCDIIDYERGFVKSSVIHRQRWGEVHRFVKHDFKKNSIIWTLDGFMYVFVFWFFLLHLTQHLNFCLNQGGPISHEYSD